MATRCWVLEMSDRFMWLHDGKTRLHGKIRSSFPSAMTTAARSLAVKMSRYTLFLLFFTRCNVVSVTKSSPNFWSEWSMAHTGSMLFCVHST